MTTKDNGGVAHMTPAELLALYDRFMSGVGVTETELAQVDHIALAAAFGSAAYDARMYDGQGMHAMMKSILIALVDPMHPYLDYLRQDPAAAAAAREDTA